MNDDALDPLVRDLVGWVAEQPRTYSQVMEAWRTSCPRLPVWEEAVDRGLLVRAQSDSGRPMVQITDRGAAFLSAR